MSESAFVHLHLHTMYSLLDGAIRVPDLMKRACDYGMKAVALTDHGNMFGAVDFFQQAKKKGLKPIIGCEVYVAPQGRFVKNKRSDAEWDNAHHLVLLAMNEQGYKNLCQLVTKGYLEGFYYKPRIDKELLIEHHQGLIALSACLGGIIASPLRRQDRVTAAAEVEFYRDLFDDRRFFLEIQENGMAEQVEVNRQIIELAQEYSVPLVATNDCHFLNREDAHAHEVLLCVQTGKNMDDPKRMRYPEELYFKSSEEMAQAFVDYPEAISNTVEIADRCNFEFEFRNYRPPNFVPPEGKTLNDFLVEECRDGLAKMWPRIEAYYDGNFTPELQESYRQRLEREIGIICDMGFAGYFLIVADFVNYARRKKIPVGPGRGSAAGSLVAYALRITDIDPLPYGLLFERFLNPERVSMPDIDMDFCIHGRDQVIKYVTEKYGEDRVAQIITFGRMQAKGVIRDVGRALHMPFAEVGKIAKLVPNELKMTLKKAEELEPGFAKLRQGNALERELIEVAGSLEGLNRHASVHAAGVVVTDQPLVDYLPLYRGAKDDDVVVTQYDMGFVEELGLIKFDFLGLKTLTVIDNALKIINRNCKQEEDLFDVSTIPLDDPATYALLSSGAAVGVFQLESSGMQDLLVKLKPGCFEDIIALVALYRPGPIESGMIDDFIACKHGRQKVEYLLPELESILKETYGVIVYQEQVMQIAQKLARYSLGQADILRKAMGKKNAEVMAAQRDSFLVGARENQVDSQKAEEIFDLMAQFAEYGFNKSHSAAYGYVAYQTAYLKAHYPVEFMAGLLMEDMNNTDKVIKNIAECRSMGIKVLPPDVNVSELSFTVVDQDIRFGLAAVKNVGGKAAAEIIRVREIEGGYKSLFDLCCRLDLSKVNRRVLESLIKSGAFDGEGVARPRLFAAIDTAMENGQSASRDRVCGQQSLFAFAGEELAVGEACYPDDIAVWSDKEQLTYERDVLGFYLSSHPLQRYVDELKRCTTSIAADLVNCGNSSQMRVGGLLTSVRSKRTKNGKIMAFAVLEDLSGSVEVTLFEETFTKAKEFIENDDPLILEGRIEINDDHTKAKMVVSEIFGLEEALSTVIEKVLMTLSHEQAAPARLAMLQDIMQRHRGNCPAFINIVMPDCEVVMALEKFPLLPSADLAHDVKGLYGGNGNGNRIVEFVS
ncbi:MAG: DNA polymerase III subunit alpha [Pseudomonadota bacterium]|nr:DNA polymerase III subunit alpha [Pseudomonadota bacterium]